MLMMLLNINNYNGISDGGDREVYCHNKRTIRKRNSLTNLIE